MGNILKVGKMFLFVPPGEPESETRPHVHVSRIGGNKRVNLKFWLGPNTELARKHRSFKDKEVALALKLVKDNWSTCMSEWMEMYGERLVRG